MAVPPNSQDREQQSRAAAPTPGQPKSARARGPVTIGGFKPGNQRNPRAVAIAVVAHLVIAIVLLRAITFDTGFRDYFGFAPEEKAVERVTFVETTPPPKPEEVAPREPSRPAAAPAPSRGPVLAEPNAVAALPGPLVAPRTDSGPIVNRLPAAEAAVVGLVPRADSRLWTMTDLRELRDEVRAASAGGYAGARELDSVMNWALGSARDSLDSLRVIRGVGATTASWTKKDSQGRTWGVDPSGIRLGKVTIPSALLGLLPLGAQQAMSGNPTSSERARRLSYAQSDIARFRDAGPGNDQFKMLVQELRERRDRERAQKRAMNAQPVRPASGSTNEVPPGGSSRP